MRDMVLCIKTLKLPYVLIIVWIIILAMLPSAFETFQEASEADHMYRFVCTFNQDCPLKYDSCHFFR